MRSRTFFDVANSFEPMEMPPILCPPDLSDRPHRVRTDRIMQVPADRLYAAFTEELDQWFAAPGSVMMRVEPNAPFYFETKHQAESEVAAVRHPHYGRFLRLVPGRLLQMTWVTGANGTAGVETMLTIELSALGGSTSVKLTHEGFADEMTADQHAKAWPFVLAQLESKFG